MARLEMISDEAIDPTIRKVFMETRARSKANEVPNLYRTLGNAPAMLQAWVNFTWPLREASVTAGRLRELAILRAAELAGADYEYAHHLPMALHHGVSRSQVDSLATWQGSTDFDEQERALLRFVEAVAASDVNDEAYAQLASHFSAQMIVELTLATSFYFAVLPRVVQALQIELEPAYSDVGQDNAA
jgi:alkylhydroperoxidase family enzyme